MSAVQGQSYTFLFPCVASSNPATKTAPTWAAGDTKITKPGGAGAVNTTNLPTNIGASGNAQLVLTAAEMGIGLADGQVGEVLLEISNAVIIPLLGVTIEIQATAPGALTSSERASTAGVVATAVGALAVEGSRTLVQLLRLLSSRLITKAQVPMGAAGGPITGRDAADTKNRLVGSVSSTGEVSWTTLDGD